jgi:hypothetical protein
MSIDNSGLVVRRPDGSLWRTDESGRQVPVRLPLTEAQKNESLSEFVRELDALLAACSDEERQKPWAVWARRTMVETRSYLDSRGVRV